MSINSESNTGTKCLLSFAMSIFIVANNDTSVLTVLHDITSRNVGGKLFNVNLLLGYKLYY